jgi:hypothetical protein
MAAKNPHLKERPTEQPYAVYRSRALPGWEWRVLKVWQNEDKRKTDPFARAFCAVSSPNTFGGADLGDTYVREVGEVFIEGEDVLAGVPRVTAGECASPFTSALA